MILDFKRKLLVDEAFKLKELEDLLGDNRDILVRKLIQDQNESNLDIAFIKYCIGQVEKICGYLDMNHQPSEFVWKDKTMSMWMEMDRRYRKQRATAGDIVIMHYMKHGKLLTSGQVGIITEVNKDLTIKTLEGNIITHFEDVPIPQQNVGIHRKLRNPKGTSKMRVLGYFSPWLDR